MDNKSLLVIRKIAYWLILLFVIVITACGLLALAIILFPSGDQVFEITQLILPAVCFLLAVAGIFVMKSYKKRIRKLEKGV